MTGFVYLLDLFVERERRGGVIYCVRWSLDDWANGGFTDSFFAHGMFLVLLGLVVILGIGMEHNDKIMLHYFMEAIH